MSHPKLTCQRLMVEGDGLWIAGGSRMCILVKYREEEKGLQERSFNPFTDKSLGFLCGYF